MNRNDWQTAMENEAACAPDPVWAEETCRATRRGWQRQLPAALLLFALLAVIQVLLFAAHPPAQLWLGVMLAVAVLSLPLGWGGVNAYAAGLGAAAYFPAAWLTVVLWQRLGGGPTAPGIDDMGSVVLMVIAMNGAGVGATLRRLRLRPH